MEILLSLFALSDTISFYIESNFLSKRSNFKRTQINSDIWNISIELENSTYEKQTASICGRNFIFNFDYKLDNKLELTITILFFLYEMFRCCVFLCVFFICMYWIVIEMSKYICDKHTQLIYHMTLVLSVIWSKMHGILNSNRTFHFFR